MANNSLEFLKEKGMIKEGFSKFCINGDFGAIELTQLLDEYLETMIKNNLHKFEVKFTLSGEDLKTIIGRVNKFQDRL